MQLAFIQDYFTILMVVNTFRYIGCTIQNQLRNRHKGQQYTFNAISWHNNNLIGDNNTIGNKMETMTNKRCKENKLKTEKVSIKESIMGACTNIMYKLGVIGGIKKMPQFLKSTPENNRIVILGESIDDKVLAKQIVSKVIWFTYRQKLKIAEDLNSDVGWGCLPRVGQMVLAQAIVRHLRNKNPIDQNQYRKIILPFIDDIQQQSAGYSLSMILKYARWRCAINPGDWFNIGQVSQVLRKIQDQKPLKGTQNLKIVFFNQSVIFLDIIQEKAKITECKCENKKIFCILCNKITKSEIQSVNKEQNQKQDQKSKQFVLTIQQYDSGAQKVNQQDEQIKQIHNQQTECCKDWEVYDEKNEGQWNKQKIKKEEKSDKNQNVQPKAIIQSQQTQMKINLLLIVSVRTSEKKIDKFDFQSILALLSLPSSIGIIGGVPSKALYIVGYEGNQLIYLDPHYVQEYVDRQNYTEHLNTFFCSQYRTISMQALDPSMAMCFYIKTIEELQNLLIKIQQLKQLYSKNDKCFFISVMEKDNFQEECEEDRSRSKDSSQNTFQKSFQYNSLEFRDISDSL